MMETIGERIRAIRQLSNEKQVEMGERLGVDRAHISKIETNKANPSKRLIKAMCMSYGVREAWLLDGEEPLSDPDHRCPFDQHLVNMEKEIFAGAVWGLILQMLYEVHSNAEKMNIDFLFAWNEFELRNQSDLLLDGGILRNFEYPIWLYPENFASIIAFGKDLVKETGEGITPPIPDPPEEFRNREERIKDMLRETKKTLRWLNAFVDGVEKRFKFKKDRKPDVFKE